MEGQAQELNPSTVNQTQTNDTRQRRERPLGPWSDEELVVINKWRHDSFWYKCMPLAGFFYFTSEFLIRQGRLKFLAKYRPVSRIFIQFLSGYILGKTLSYRELESRMLEKFPDGVVAKNRRRREEQYANYRQQRQAESERLESEPNRSENTPQGLESTLPGLSQPSPGVTDTTVTQPVRRNQKGFYDGLREQNRGSSSVSQSDREPVFFADKPTGSIHKGQKTKYGDEWEEE